MRYKQLLIRGWADPRFPKRHWWNKCRKKRVKSRKNRHFRVFLALHPLKGPKKIPLRGQTLGGDPPDPPLTYLFGYDYKEGRGSSFSKNDCFRQISPRFLPFHKNAVGSYIPPSIPLQGEVLEARARGSPHTGIVVGVGHQDERTPNFVRSSPLHRLTRKRVSWRRAHCVQCGARIARNAVRALRVKWGFRRPE